ncbi:hypothetical protein [Stomatohabitans albus]|uniref:hypothetical protein n=1 Tax=Stomatohabitans albus TaxID=3110766 RepID=UPI00300C382D
MAATAAIVISLLPFNAIAESITGASGIDASAGSEYVIDDVLEGPQVFSDAEIAEQQDIEANAIGGWVEGKGYFTNDESVFSIKDRNASSPLGDSSKSYE